MDRDFSDSYNNVRKTQLESNYWTHLSEKTNEKLTKTFSTELIFGIAIATATKMKKVTLCCISVLYIGILVVTVEFLFFTVLVASDIQYLLSNSELSYSSCLSNVNILGFSIWQMIQYILALYAIIKFQIDFNAKRRKKLSRYVAYI